jgi:flagellar assembly factor FliW
MNLQTSRFGEIEIDEDKIITFPQGIPFFESMHRYIMLQPDLSVPFIFMQSIEEGDLAFIVADPFTYFPDYDFKLPESVQAELNIQEEAEVMVFNLISISETDEFSMNLLAPVVLNMRLKQGKQVILYQTEYKTKHPLVFANPIDPSEKQTQFQGEGE